MCDLIITCAISLLLVLTSIVLLRKKGEKEEKRGNRKVDEKGKEILFKKSQGEKGEFEKAALFVSDGMKEFPEIELSQGVQLELYSYYKQVTVGKAKKNIKSKPGGFNMERILKWKAWEGLGDMSEEESREKYVKLVDHNVPEWREWKPKLSNMREQKKEVVEESVKIIEKKLYPSHTLLLFSSETKDELEELTKEIYENLRSLENCTFQPFLFRGFSIGKENFSQRRYLCTSSFDEALKDIENKKFFTSNIKGKKVPKVAFMFPGIGSEYAGMTKDLYNQNWYYRETVDEVLHFLKEEKGIDFFGFFRDREAKREESDKFSSFQLLMIFVVEHALSKLLMHWGIKPVIAIGSSLGEYNAASLAGVLGIKEVMLVLLEGALLSFKCPKAEMLLLELSENEIRKIIKENILEKKIFLCVINSPKQVVVGGKIEYIPEFVNLLEKSKICYKRMSAIRGWHTELIIPSIQDTFVDCIKQLCDLREPNMPYMSCVTGGLCKKEEAVKPEYYGIQATQTVHFSKGIEYILKRYDDLVLVEIGPNRALCNIVKEHSLKESQVCIDTIRHKLVLENDVEILMKSMGKLWEKGINVDWANVYSSFTNKVEKNVVKSFHEGGERLKVPLPHSREKCWIINNKKNEIKDKRKDVLVNYCEINSIVKEILCTKEDINPEKYMVSYGFTSLQALSLIYILRDKFNINIEMKELYYITINDILKKQTFECKPVVGEILKRNKKSRIPLSFTQESLFFIEKITEEPSLYMIPFAIKLSGLLHINIVEKSIMKIIERHEIFRTSFNMGSDKQLYQEVQKEINFFKIEVINCKNIENIKEMIREDLCKKFDLSKDLLIRFKLYRINNDENVLYVNFHHIIFDMVSAYVFMKEFCNLYNSYTLGQPAKLKTNELHYGDYSLWQRKFVSDDVILEQFKYWKRLLENIPMILNLPTDYPRSNKTSYKGESIIICIKSETTRKLMDFSSGNDVSLFITYFSIFQVLMYKYSGEKRFCIGIPFFNRPRGCERMIGCFVNVLPCPVNIEKGLTFVEFVRKVKNCVMDCLAHQDIPFEKIVEKLNVQRNIYTNPIFQVVFQFFNQSKSIDFELTNLVQSFIILELEISQFDMSFEIHEGSDEMKLKIEYSNELFESGFIKHMLKNYELLIKIVSHEYEKSINEICMLFQNESLKPILELNKVKEAYSSLSIQEIFYNIVEQQSNHTSVTFENKSLSYKELNERSNQIANYLRNSMLIKQGDFVGVYLHKSIDLISCVLGVIKSGGVYLPLNPRLPKERVKFMIEDANCKVLLVENDCVLHFDGKMIEITNNTEIEMCDKSNLKNISRLDSLLYVIYTSGSTGQPKGVLIEQKSLLSMVESFSKRIEIDIKDKYAFFNDVSFDVSISDMMCSLLNGCTLVGIPETMNNNPKGLLNYVDEMKITILDIPATLLKALPTKKRTESLRVLIVGGDICNEDTMKIWSQKVPVFVNAYGPTEVAVTTHMKLWKKSDHHRNIGNKLSSIINYIVDENLNHVPVLVHGELVIGGTQVARGYLNRKELTRTKFIKSKFDENCTLYRTGDICKFLPNGEVVFHGRKDYQVKVRGFRIELSEIENNLKRLKGIKNAIVLFKEDKSRNKRLIACIEKEQRSFIDESEFFINELSKTLPDYMIPSNYSFFDKFPINLSGKVDRKELSKVQFEKSSSYVGPSNEMEVILCNIWSEHFKIDNIGINDSFFEIGGNSLSYISLFEKYPPFLKEKISFREAYSRPTIHKILSYYSNQKNRENEFHVFDQEKIINLDKEKKLMDEIVSKFKKRESNTGVKICGIFMTGSTGFLGRNVVFSLLKELEKNVLIYCLVKKSSVKGLKILDNQRIITLFGDLGEERFGLKLESFNNLKKNVQLIIHCGAIVNDVLDYENLYNVNVRSVFDILRLSEGYKMIHFISTTGVYYKVKRNKKIEDINFPKMYGYNGTKWAAEVLLQKCYKNVIIHRTALIGPSKICTSYNPRDWFTAFVSDVFASNIVYNNKMVHIPLDIMSVDFVSSVISRSVCRPNLGGKIFMYSLKNVSLKDVVTYIEILKGVSMKTENLQYDEMLSHSEKRKSRNIFLKLWKTEPTSFPGYNSTIEYGISSDLKDFIIKEGLELEKKYNFEDLKPFLIELMNLNKNNK